MFNIKTYQYKSERVQLGGVFSASMKVDYRDVIAQNASKGWRFVQVVTPEYTGSGIPKYLEIVFEKEVVS